MELEYTRIEAFEVKGIRFTCVSKWNGMEEWKDDKGRKMIVTRKDSEEHPYADAIARTFGVFDLAKEPSKLLVISASPDLAALFKV